MPRATGETGTAPRSRSVSGSASALRSAADPRPFAVAGAQPAGDASSPPDGMPERMTIGGLDFAVRQSASRQPRHTPAFWATVARAMPDHAQRRARLATTGATLWLG